MAVEEVVEGVTDIVDESVNELDVVEADGELFDVESGAAPVLIVTVEDGNMLTTGMVDVSAGRVLLGATEPDDVEEVGA